TETKQLELVCHEALLFINPRTSHRGFSTSHSPPFPLSICFTFPQSTETMASHHHLMKTMLPLFLLLATVFTGAMAAAPKKPVNIPFGRNYAPTRAFDHIKYYNGGNDIQLVLDKYTGTGFQSKGSYLFGHFNVQIKMVPGDLAGTVTAFYTCMGPAPCYANDCSRPRGNPNSQRRELG
ncbi:unnamed protein product, partial [Linum tenue]